MKTNGHTCQAEWHRMENDLIVKKLPGAISIDSPLYCKSQKVISPSELVSRFVGRAVTSYNKVNPYTK